MRYTIYSIFNKRIKFYLGFVEENLKYNRRNCSSLRKCFSTMRDITSQEIPLKLKKWFCKTRLELLCIFATYFNFRLDRLKNYNKKRKLAIILSPSPVSHFPISLVTYYFYLVRVCSLYILFCDHSSCIKVDLVCSLAVL